MMLGSLELQLCDIQGRLFELSATQGVDSAWFIQTFMTGDTAAHFDLPYDRTQWMGEEYLLAEVLEDAEQPTHSKLYAPDELYWIGYTYRYWHYYRDVSSQAIWRKADAEMMRRLYPGYHTLDCAQAIERIEELSRLP